MSALGGKADISDGCASGPLLTLSRHHCQKGEEAACRGKNLYRQVLSRVGGLDIAVVWATASLPASWIVYQRSSVSDQTSTRSDQGETGERAGDVT